MGSQATMVPSEKDAQMNNSVKNQQEGNYILNNSNVIRHQNIKMKFVNFCTVRNDRKQLVSSYGSEKESSSRELEFADGEYEKEHRSVLDDNLRPFIKAAAPDFTFSQGPTEQDTSFESVTDNECVRVSCGAGFSESPVIPSADNVNDTAVGGENPILFLQVGRPSGIYSEITKADAISLNAFSTMAVFSRFGLKIVPSLRRFSSLKTLDLSGNCIQRIIPGSLPRSLHSLDLSRNRITLVEGLRDLTRLRVINLSYNRISRIGHGLANCTLTKELYLSGNSISDVEGLHRLSKLSVLDLGFNKLTTSKSLGQLAANYSSLLTLNLLGNPVHATLGEDQLRRLVITLVPHLNFLNKQPVKAISAREVVMDSVAQAAMDSSHRTRRRTRKAGRAPVQKNRLPAHGTKKVARTHGDSRVSEFNRAKHRASGMQQLEKGFDREKQRCESLSPCSADEPLTQPMDQARKESMPCSRSEGILCDQN